MSKELSHQNYARHSEAITGLPPMEEVDESHELAVDMQTIGAIAVGSEVEAAQTVERNPDVDVPNPITPKMLRKKTVISLGDDEGRVLRREQDKAAVEADSALQELEVELTDLVETGDAITSREYLSRKLATARSRHYNVSPNSNFDFILDGMEIPPFLTMIKENNTVSEIGWSNWLRMASNEQLINFSQWYTDQLRMHLDPETRPAVVEQLKQNYLEPVRKAMSQGWIDKKYEKELVKRVGGTQIVFFSPFGNNPDQFGGQAWRGTLFLPVGAGEHISMHEFGHIFAGLSLKDVMKYLGVRKTEVNKAPRAIEQMYEIINEGFNEHMTVALREGSFDIIRPSEREKAGLTEPDDSSEIYRLYREVFGALVAGPQHANALSQAEIKELTGTMIRRDFSSFANFVSERWDDHDMIKEIYSLLTRMEASNPAVIRVDNGANKAAEAILEMLSADKIVPSAA